MPLPVTEKHSVSATTPFVEAVLPEVALSGKPDVKFRSHAQAVFFPLHKPVSASTKLNSYLQKRMHIYKYI